MKRLLFAISLSVIATGAGADSVVIPSTSTSSTSQTLPVVTEGSACTATPSSNTGIKADYSAILTCQNGVWTKAVGRYFRDPVANYSSLPLTGNEKGDVRITLDTGRAFTWNGSTWQALSIDQNGNLTVPGQVQMGTAYLTTVVAENTGCSPNGSVARDANGLLLSCQSGVWKKGQGGLETGRKGLLQPLLGKTISCMGYSPYSNTYVTGKAFVDTNGNLFLTISSSFDYWGYYTYNTYTCVNTMACSLYPSYYNTSIINYSVLGITVLEIGYYDTVIGDNISGTYYYQQDICAATWPAT